MGSNFIEKVSSILDLDYSTFSLSEFFYKITRKGNFLDFKTETPVIKATGYTLKAWKCIDRNLRPPNSSRTKALKYSIEMPCGKLTGQAEKPQRLLALAYLMLKSSYV